MPTTETATIGSGGGFDYSSLFSAEAGRQGNYVAADKIMVYSHQLAGDTTAVTFSGSSTDIDHYIRVTAPLGWRHSGVWDATKSYISVSGSTGIAIADLFVTCEWLQVKCSASSGSSKSAFRMTSGDTAQISISNCIMTAVMTGTASGSYGIQCATSPTGSRSLKVKNCISYDWVNGTNTLAGFSASTGWVAYFYNCTVQNCRNGFLQGGSASIVVKNSLVSSCNAAATGTFAAGTDYNSTNNASMGYTVTGGGNANDRTSQTFTFVNEGSDNFQLTSADTGAKGYGVDLSADANLPFSDDIAGSTRSAPWDIGAFKFQSSFSPAWCGPASHTIGGHSA